MSYRCDICDTQVEAGIQLIRHTIYRDKKEHAFKPDEGQVTTTRREIAYEIPVCSNCSESLKKPNVTLAYLRNKYKQPAKPKAPVISPLFFK